MKQLLLCWVRCARDHTERLAELLERLRSSERSKQTVFFAPQIGGIC
jgi:hypothetical protein